MAVAAMVPVSGVVSRLITRAADIAPMQRFRSARLDKVADESRSRLSLPP